MIRDTSKQLTSVIGDVDKCCGQSAGVRTGLYLLDLRARASSLAAALLSGCYPVAPARQTALAGARYLVKLRAT